MAYSICQYLSLLYANPCHAITSSLTLHYMLMCIRTLTGKWDVANRQVYEDDLSIDNGSFEL